jgi:hypothetical protein
MKHLKINKMSKHILFQDKINPVTKEQVNRELDNILESLYDRVIEPYDAKPQLLDLLETHTLTFNIGDKVKWRGMDLVVVEVGIGEILIATHENVDYETYNDWWVDNKYVQKF